ncbi:hypothetical protein AgCh_030379 [Apium graveolens]
MWRREIVAWNASHADLITEHQMLAALDFYAKRRRNAKGLCEIGLPWLVPTKLEEVAASWSADDTLCI